MKSLFGGPICLLDMEDEKEYLETDVRKIILENAKELGLDANFIDPSVSDAEKPPYYSSHFAGSIFRMVDSVGTMRVKGQNFDYIHIVRRG